MAPKLRGAYLLLLASSLAAFAAAGAPAEKKWFKGNTHTHTLWSDGDAPPEQVSEWYKSKGYRFLVLSDHNILAEGEKWKKVGTARGEYAPDRFEEHLRRHGKSVEVRERDGKREMRLKTLDELRAAFEEKDRFIFIKGEEITDQFKNLPIHHNSMNHSHFIRPPHGESVRDVLEKTIRAVEEEARACGRPVLVHLNHPNFGWGVDPEDIAHVKGERYFEVYNGHRGVRNYGDKDHRGTEAIWDYVLTVRLASIGGEALFGLATDDAHHYHKEQAVANPGRGWVMVRAEELTGDAITQALLAGDFYSSSGVTLEDVSSDRSGLRLRIRAEPGVTYTTVFVGTRVEGEKAGPPGVVLGIVAGPEAAYAFKGDELYVRATVVSSRRHPNGYDPGDLESAWVQPVVVRRLAK
jgi:hypothetical protein